LILHHNKAETVNPPRTEYLAVYSALRQLLKPYEDDLTVKTDKPGQCYLETRSAKFSGRRLFFAAAKIKKKYVRFGLEDGSEHTLEEVGHKFQVTRERIRQIEGKALRKLRHIPFQQVETVCRPAKP
jgi:hypothetical protein